jgi:hypothetical protein
MILIFHLIFAFGSMGYATYLYFSPSKRGLLVTYTLVALTFASGFLLVFTAPANMTEVCAVGLAYLGYVTYAIVASRNKLAVKKVL